MTEQENILRLIEAAGPVARTPFPEWCVRFAAIVKAEAVAETREACAKLLVDLGDGYGVRDQGLDAKTYSRMQQTAYEHAAAVMTGGKKITALSSAELASIRAVAATPSREGDEPGENHE